MARAAEAAQDTSTERAAALVPAVENQLRRAEAPKFPPALLPPVPQ
ncbi:hypothetical protein [Streptomyces sp. NPDC002530]